MGVVGENGVQMEPLVGGSGPDRTYAAKGDLGDETHPSPSILSVHDRACQLNTLSIGPLEIRRDF